MASQNSKMLRRHFERSEEWEKPTRKQDEERALKTLAMIPKEVTSVLEVGTGNGLIINKVESCKFAVGLDFSRTALGHVRKERVEGDCAHLPIADNSFDIVIAAEVLEHLADEAMLMSARELIRVTRRFVLVSVPFEENPWETFVRCADCGYAYSPYGHQQYFDRKRIENLIQAKDKDVELWGSKRTLPLITLLGQKVFGVYSYRAGSECPRCGSRRLKYSRFSEIFTTFVSILQKRLARVTPDTILCLYRVK